MYKCIYYSKHIPVGIWFTITGIIIVDVIAFEREHLLSIGECLVMRCPWFSKLSCHSGNSNNRNSRSPQYHQRHLKKDLEFVLNGSLGTILKSLCAVSSLINRVLYNNNHNQNRINGRVRDSFSYIGDISNELRISINTIDDNMYLL